MKYQLCIAVLLATALSLCEAGDCSQLKSCVTCIESEPSLNISCEWVTCGASENSSCVSKKEYTHEFCTVLNRSPMCAGERPNEERGNALENRSTSFPENRLAEPEEVSPEDFPDSATESPPVFHTGSFIGGGVLVILLEAVGYIALRYLRGPESGYQTMEETPQ
ncbi:CD164 sialomucin-like 2 protein [Hyla sarda]|uniref:CD164 sialomucin-like 2 protein n=1 Tax=Hyla sarda TaxID=327740 RepID=UPI0024C42C8B|nr:CD164 sialomucin-like 2 protein [Hyla sarda]